MVNISSLTNVFLFFCLCQKKHYESAGARYMSRDSRYIHNLWHLEVPSLAIGVAQPMMRNPCAELAVDFDDPVSFRPESADLPAALGVARTCDRMQRAGGGGSGGVGDLAGSTLLEVPSGGVPGFSTLQLCVVWGERFGLPSTLE